MTLVKPIHESSVFNYDEEIRDQKTRYYAKPDQSSSALLSIAKEDTFGNSYETENINDESYESSKESFSISNEEPPVKNIGDYNFRNEMCLNKMKKQDNIDEEESDFMNVSEKSQNYDTMPNLQSNMKKIENYYIGRNQMMKDNKSLPINQL